MMTWCERALQMHIDHAIPIRFAHREDHTVTQNAGIVDQDVETTKGFDRLIDHVLGFAKVGNIAAIDDGFATHFLDLSNDIFSRTCVGATAISGPTQVVYDDLCTV